MSKQVYFFCGEETYLTDQAISTLKHQHRASHQVQFSDQFSVAELRDCISMTALFSTTQLILVKNPWFLNKAPSDKEVEMIKQFITMVPNTDHTLVIYVLGPVDQRKKVASFLKKNSAFTRHSPFNQWEQDKVLQWLENAIKTRSKTIEQSALIALEQIGGTQLQLLSNELDTLCLYIGNRPHITLDDIKEMSADKSANTFHLIDALKAGDTAEIIGCVDRLLHSGEDPIRLMGLIVSQVRLFVQLLQLQSQRLSSQDIAKEVGKNPYYIQKLLPQLLKKHSLTGVTQQLIRLATADYEIKSGKKKPESALKVALL
jgi:DNA polymerase-3 subunit delta